MSTDTTVPNDASNEGPEVWRIEPTPPTIAGQLSALMRHRYLLWFFSVHSVFDLYRNSLFGILWMVIRPLALALPAVFVVGNLFGISVDPVPLPLFILVGLASWTLFRRTLMHMTKALLRNRNILQQVYIPALLLVIASSAPGFIEFAVVFTLFLVAAIYYGPIAGVFYPSIGLSTLGLIPAVTLTFILAVAVGCFTSFMNAVARDTNLFLRYAISAWMLATPVIYPIEIIPEHYRWIMYLNPMTSVIELYRWALLGYGSMHWQYLGLAVIEIVALLMLGIWFFAKQQNRLFDHM
jgi:homopolymeric O-antigen transport system permease protein